VADSKKPKIKKVKKQVQQVAPVVYDWSNTSPHTPGEKLPPGRWLCFYPNGQATITASSYRSTCTRIAPVPVMENVNALNFSQMWERCRDGKLCECVQSTDTSTVGYLVSLDSRGELYWLRKGTLQPRGLVTLTVDLFEALFLEVKPEKK
jgi:hypothetical protein